MVEEGFEVSGFFEILTVFEVISSGQESEGSEVVGIGFDGKSTSFYGDIEDGNTYIPSFFSRSIF